MWAFAREQEQYLLAKNNVRKIQDNLEAENAESIVKNLAQPNRSLLYNQNEDCFIKIPLLSEFEAQHLDEIKAMMQKYEINQEVEESSESSPSPPPTIQLEAPPHHERGRPRRNSNLRQIAEREKIKQEAAKTQEVTETDLKPPQPINMSITAEVKDNEKSSGSNFANQYVYNRPSARLESRPTRKEILAQNFPDYLIKINLNPINSNAPIKGKPGKKGKQVTEEYIIEKILGITNYQAAKTKPTKYLIKYIDVSYLHCDLITREEVLVRDGGKNALKEFEAARLKRPLSRSFIFQNLLVVDNSEIEPMWFNLERIIDESNDDNRLEYLAKWKDLDYEQCTWEPKTFIKSELVIKQYKQHIDGTNKRKIPSRWKRPTEKEFSPVKHCDDSLTGLNLSDQMTNCINFLISGYFRRENVIHADVSPRLQRYQVAASLDYLTDQTKFNGPILALTDKTALNDWKDAFDEWTGFNSVVCSGARKSLTALVETEFNVVDSNGKPQNSLIQADVIITPYETYRDNPSVFDGIEFRVLLIDAVNFDQFSKKWVQSISSEYIIVTIPHTVKEKVSDIYDILQFTNPNVFKDSKHKFFSQFDSSDATTCKKLNDFLKPYLIEHSSKDEECDYHMIEVEPSPAQVQAALDVISNSKEILMNPTSENTTAQRYIFTLLRYISDHPSLVFQNSEPKELINSSGKFVFIDKILHSRFADKKKFLIFSEIPDSLSLIGQMLDNLGIRFMKMSFNQTDDELNAAIDQFDEDENIKVFLYSSKKGARKIDTSVFDRIILLDDDTFHLRSGPKIPIFHLITKCFPDEALYSRNLCYDENAVFTSPPEGPFPPHSSVLSCFILSTYLKLLNCSNKEYLSWTNHSVEETIKKCKHQNVGHRLVSISEQYNFYMKSVENTTDNIKLVTSLIDIGPRNHANAAKCIRSALQEIQKRSLEHKEKELLKNVVKKMTIGEDDNVKFLVDNSYISQQASLIIERTLLFYQIQRALFVLTEFTRAPSFCGFPIATVYCLLYSVYANGIVETLSVAQEKIDQVKDESTFVTFLKNVTNEINSTYSPSDEFFYLDYIPIPPERWVLIVNSFSEILSEKVVESEPEIPEIKPNKNDIIPQSAGELDKKIMLNLHRHPFEPMPQKNVKQVVDCVFSTILDIGLPLSESGEIDWKNFASKVGTNSDVDKIKNIACQIVKTCVAVMQQGKDYDPSENESLKDFSQKINIHVAKNLIQTIRIMSLLYNLEFCSLSDAMSKVPKHPSLPSWWTLDHFTSLFEVTRKYGTFSFFRWVVDKNLPFAEHIKKSYLPNFENTAASEVKGELKSASEIPNKLGDFNLLVKRRFRLGICLWAIDQLGKTFSQANNVKNNDESLKIVSFGRIVSNDNFNCPYCPYPIGFVSERLFKAPDERESQWYRCEISCECGNPLFTVSPVADPIKEWIGATPKEAWKRAFGKIKKVDSIKFSGLWLFGLVSAAAINHFKEVNAKVDSLPEASFKSSEAAANSLTNE
ncbi:hypothetical protein TVAG_387750 [Trichomonas vaginalis G3]|uniref:Chromo domain-containing protein n=1 Tax=Trichomonas vaginalis (strain ATCC PRA-98 / G3) TaxID=412133 RepID=A2E102_TRIV3|nr:helicase protein [Trichomonas vaginalis G3]EAY13634.1 hypothetical protein TVAG_387750 [Trichomonas vaginalis G3]KAI5529901.1 helicase protein [Trichomonas vaginalis G3]|eukprot:XP_001325857.1 hypothetical protein [Trichomonas vaginalis G3]